MDFGRTIIICPIVSTTLTISIALIPRFCTTKTTYETSIKYGCPFRFARINFISIDLIFGFWFAFDYLPRTCRPRGPPRGPPIPNEPGTLSGFGVAFLTSTSLPEIVCFGVLSSSFTTCSESKVMKQNALRWFFCLSNGISTSMIYFANKIKHTALKFRPVHSISISIEGIEFHSRCQIDRRMFWFLRRWFQPWGHRQRFCHGVPLPSLDQLFCCWSHVQQQP